VREKNSSKGSEAVFWVENREAKRVSLDPCHGFSMTEGEGVGKRGGCRKNASRKKKKKKKRG